MMFIWVWGGGFQTLNGAIVSHITDPAYFGRVVSLTFLAFAAFAVVALPVRLLADEIGERATLAVMGFGVCLIVGVFALVGRDVTRIEAAERPASLGAGPVQGR
jgi:hypothetical protein